MVISDPNLLPIAEFPGATACKDRTTQRKSQPTTILRPVDFEPTGKKTLDLGHSKQGWKYR